MRFRSLCIGLFMMAAVQAVGALPAPPVEPFTPASASDRGLELLPAGSPGAASELQNAAECNADKPRASVVALRWQPGQGGPASVQHVDISKFRDGFATGRFETTRELNATTAAVAVDAPEPGLNYYWRVRTQTATGWAVSADGRFEVPVCPHDPLDESVYDRLLNGANNAANTGSANNGADQGGVNQ